MSSKIKAGVIGAGYLGKIHLRLINESSLYDLIGFYDNDKKSSKKLSKEFGYTLFNSIEELIESCEMIDIITPTSSHYEIACQCIKSNKHVFIEKPITDSVENANELVRLADIYKIKGQVGHVERFNPAFIAVKNIIENPKFIETHRLAEFNPRGTDVPVVLDLMIHDIDIILSVVKSKVITISAAGISVISKTPDIANARLEFENGCVANLTASRISLKNMRKSRFFQNNAYISVDFLSKSVEVVKMKEAPSNPEEFAIILQNAEGKKKQIYFNSPIIGSSNAILEELNSFAVSINNNLETQVTFKQASEALRIAHLIINSF